MSGEKKIEAYVDAVRGHRALLRATELEGKTPERDRLTKMAAATVSERIRCLTGGQIGEARRRLDQVTL